MAELQLFVVHSADNLLHSDIPKRGEKSQVNMLKFAGKKQNKALQ